MIDPLASQPYLDAVGKHCQKLSFDDLCEIISELAQKVPPHKRAEFLDTLYACSQNNVNVVVDVSYELIARIDALKNQIAKRQETRQPESETFDALSEEQCKELQGFFVEADTLFGSNETEYACEAYDVLLDMFRSDRYDEEFSYQLHDCDVDINWREIRARYCRCVYETSGSAQKVTRMLHAMQVDVKMCESRYAPSEEVYPTLQDIFIAKAGALPDWEEFLTVWIDSLEGKTNNRAFLLFLEATNWLEGLNGVAREVRKHHIPIGYFYWLDMLKAGEYWEETAHVAQETMKTLPEGPLREQAEEMLGFARKNL